MLRNEGKGNLKTLNEANGGAEFKCLVLDIETAPNLGYIWGLWDQNIGINLPDPVDTPLHMFVKVIFFKKQPILAFRPGPCFMRDSHICPIH